MSLTPYRDDVHQYVRRMERAIIASLADVGIEAGPIDGLTGVWTREPRKIASIGVHVSRGVTTHGFAINVNNDLQPFEWIVPCGIENCRMTSVARELHARVRHGRASWTSSQREFGVAYGRVPVASRRTWPMASRWPRMTERLHVTRSRAKPGGTAQSDDGVVPFRSRKPPWLKVKAPGGPSYRRIERADAREVAAHRLRGGELPQHRRVLGARHRDLHDPRRRLHAPLRVLQRASPGVPDLVDRAEPLRVAHAVKQMGLRHCVVTSVDRDDLPDGGAGVFADTIRAIRKRAPGCAVEVLTPDFRGQEMPLARVIDARPDVFNHNVETVPRLYPKARRGSDFKRSCRVLLNAKRMDSDVVTKSGLMVGLGETMEEMLEAFALLREHDVQVLTVGQYLRPSENHLPLVRYWHAGGVRRARARGLRDGLRVGRLRARSCAARTTRTSRCPSAAPLPNSATSRVNLRLVTVSPARSPLYCSSWPPRPLRGPGRSSWAPRSAARTSWPIRIRATARR